MEFREARLKNGLEVIAECNPKAYSTALAFFVKTGSRDETDETAGVSHFLEHMAFKGSATRSAEDVNRELDEIGSHANAFTSEEQTVYYATVLPEYAERAVELLSDLLRPALRKADFDMEKQVILEEIAKYDDQPPFGAHEKCMALHFGAHPLGRNVLGSIETVGALTPDQMQAYFDRRYSAGNIMLAAAGNVDFQKLVGWAQKYCARWEEFSTSRELERAAPHEGFEVIQKESASQQYAVQISNGPAASDPDRYAARILATVLGDDSGSRFFWELVDTGRAECAVMHTYEYQGTGIYMTFLCCAPEEAADNLQSILELQRQGEQAGITEAELQQAKNKITAHLILQSERPGNRLFAIGSNWLQRREYRTVREVVSAYQRVTCNDVAAVLEKYPISRHTTVTVGPIREVRAPR